MQGVDAEASKLAVESAELFQLATETAVDMSTAVSLGATEWGAAMIIIVQVMSNNYS
jgi:hypothetical protein